MHCSVKRLDHTVAVNEDLARIRVSEVEVVENEESKSRRYAMIFQVQSGPSENLSCGVSKDVC